MKMVYFNTASSKCILDFFDLVAENMKETEIDWYFNEGDGDMQSAGEEYDELVDITFNIIEEDMEDDEDYY